MKVKVKKLNKDAIIPKYATPGSACFDIHSLTYGVIPPGESLLCSTGLSFEIPENHVMLVFSRSGHGFKNDIRLANCVGVIDSDYRGELAVKLTSDARENKAMKIDFEDRIAQAMIIQFDQVVFELSENLSDTQRGAGGFGSTGL